MSLREKLFNTLAPFQPALHNKINFNHVDLYYWKPTKSGLNFGDHLSSIIVNKILGDNGHMLEEETAETKKLFAVGSVLHFAKDGDVVWGSGVNGKIVSSEHTFKNLDVRAVRGPLTRDFLMQRGIKVPEVYGDPALLLPTIFPDRFVKTHEKPYVIVPNLHDLGIAVKNKWNHIISPLSSWNKCITEILKARLVIASSLHGIIIAEAFGIPAIYIRITETENLFKYNDYTMGTGRGEISYSTSLNEALEMGGMAPPVFDPQKLINAFPIDLWRKF